MFEEGSRGEAHHHLDIRLFEVPEVNEADDGTRFVSTRRLGEDQTLFRALLSSQSNRELLSRRRHLNTIVRHA